MSTAKALMQAHTCRPGGTPTGELHNRPLWGEPGELTKLAGENRWGRVVYLMRCCGERIVEFVDQDELTVGAERLRLDALESPYALSGQTPPVGYWITHRYTGRPEQFGVRS